MSRTGRSSDCRRSSSNVHNYESQIAYTLFRHSLDTFLSCTSDMQSILSEIPIRKPLSDGSVLLVGVPMNLKGGLELMGVHETREGYLVPAENVDCLWWSECAVRNQKARAVEKLRMLCLPKEDEKMFIVNNDKICVMGSFSPETIVGLQQLGGEFNEYLRVSEAANLSSGWFFDLSSLVQLMNILPTVPMLSIATAPSVAEVDLANIVRSVATKYAATPPMQWRASDPGTIIYQIQHGINPFALPLRLRPSVSCVEALLKESLELNNMAASSAQASAPETPTS